MVANIYVLSEHENNLHMSLHFIYLQFTEYCHRALGDYGLGSAKAWCVVYSTGILQVHKYTKRLDSDTMSVRGAHHG